ncbi:uncharacterized protein SPSC_05767 [Sporisorium scitamineum]|uniref:Shugoshin C-terminal domain-containing protein n=1 Tax=Sporisorium scitamineum TaxID=49012 RepID=A0A127Z5B7_9BASI|nr:uncharacterized protein SPSC_05767 [Sporisorium scitamineum]
MPPATRREVRLSASLPDPTSHNGTTHSIETSRSATMLIPNMESILENFEQFKRKHISQNREIIKANAVHQLRIRDLENRIQSLEAEKIQKDMDSVALTAQVSQLHHAIGTIHAGWEAIGRGLTLSVGHAFNPADSKQSIGPTQLPASNRVTVEPNPNAPAIVRSIARPPEGHLESLKEEHFDTEDDERSTTPLVTSDAFHDEWQHHFQAMQAAQSKQTSQPRSHSSADGATSVLDMDGAPSPMGSPELPMDLEHVIAAATARSATHQWSLPGVTPPLSASEMPFLVHSDHSEQHGPSHDSIPQSLRRSGRKSTRRQSGYFSQSGFNDSHAPNHSSDPIPAPSSEPYLPSETNSETMDGLLVYRGSDQAPMYLASSQHHPSTLADITNGGYPSPSSPYDRTATQLDASARVADATPRKTRQTSNDTVSTSHVEQSSSSPGTTYSQARTPGGRKRKVPNHETQDPMPTPARLFGATIDATPSASAITLIDGKHSSQTGRTRRVRKSINYALPKLNTKMRKPDPSDLIPASTPHRSNGTTPASARGMVGSTGNLSDIRRLHEAAALRQSPAERTSHMRSKASSTLSNGDATNGEDDGGARMADLFEIRQGANQHTTQGPSSTHALWNADGTNDTSDDDSRATSNADLGELAELEAAMSDLCTADEVPQQVDTPRAPQPSMWPSRSTAQMSASSSTDSMMSRSSSTASNGTATKRPLLRRKTTTLPSRSRQSSAEQAMQSELGNGPDSGPNVDNGGGSSDVRTVQTKGTDAEPASVTETAKTSASARKVSDSKKDSDRTRTGSAAPSSTELGNGRPPPLSAGLAAGMKPKQRPASAGAALVGSRSASASLTLSSSVDRPRTFSGTTAAKAGLTQSSASGSSTSSTSRSSSSASSSTQRTSLRSALTSETKATPGQMTPRIGSKGLPASATSSSKDSPRIAGTPILRPTPSTSSLASESSGRSSPALSVASAGTSGTQLSTSTRTSLKATASSGAVSSAKTQRPSTAGSTALSSSSSREGSTPRVNGSASNTSTSAGSARPQPARSMPSLRRATDKTGVTSTPRITVRSSSSTLPAAVGSDTLNGTHSTSAASIAASKVAKAISSNSTTRSRDAASTPMGLGIDFNDGSAEKELISSTDDLPVALQRSSSSAAPSSSLSSEAHSSSPTSTSKTSSDEAFPPGASLAKARRTSRRVSGMTA